MDGVTKKEFLSLLTGEFKVPGSAIGTIDVNRAYMHFDIGQDFVQTVRFGLEEFTINGRRVRVDEASARSGGGGGGGDRDRKFGKSGGGGDRDKGSKWGVKPDHKRRR